MASFGITAVTFVGLPALPLVTKKVFSFLGPVSVCRHSGLRLCAGIGAIVFQMPALSLAVSAMFALLMCGLILFQTQQIIRGGERNYIMPR